MLTKLPRQPSSKRKNCDSIYLTEELRQQICTVLERKYQHNGQFNMSRFLNYWEQKFQSKPPTAQTIRNLRSRYQQQKFEYWLIDGCCRLLLNCTYEEWEKHQFQLTTTPDPHEIQDLTVRDTLNQINDLVRQIQEFSSELSEKISYLYHLVQE